MTESHPVVAAYASKDDAKNKCDLKPTDTVRKGVQNNRSWWNHGVPFSSNSARY